MEQRYGVRGTISDGIFFTEKQILNAVPVKNVSVEISRQNSNLSEVKKQMARDAAAAGATAIMEFQYGQRKHGGLQLLAFKWDTESWYGKGVAVRVPVESA